AGPDELRKVGQEEYSHLGVEKLDDQPARVSTPIPAPGGAVVNFGIRPRTVPALTPGPDPQQDEVRRAAVAQHGQRERRRREQGGDAERGSHDVDGLPGLDPKHRGETGPAAAADRATHDVQHAWARRRGQHERNQREGSEYTGAWHASSLGQSAPFSAWWARPPGMRPPEPPRRDTAGAAETRAGPGQDAVFSGATGPLRPRCVARRRPRHLGTGGRYRGGICARPRRPRATWPTSPVARRRGKTWSRSSGARRSGRRHRSRTRRPLPPGSDAPVPQSRRRDECWPS